MSDPTRFDLDDRQRAMLAEMGVRVWWPQRSDAQAKALAGDAPAMAAALSATADPAMSPLHGVSGLAGAASPVRPATQAAPATRAAPPQPVVQGPATAPANAQALAFDDLSSVVSPVFAPLPQGLSSMDWDALQAAVKSCQSCSLCTTRQAPLLGTNQGPGQGSASWMVVGDMPAEADEQCGQPFTGPEGQLLDNMLKAVGVRRQGLPAEAGRPADPSAQALHAGQAQACLTHAVKCRPASGRNPQATELATCAGYLSRQVALVQPRVILAMGRFAIQSLLGTSEPLGKLRGTVHRFEGVPVVVTYPLSNLLRNPPDKAKAWADLVLALSLTQN